MSKFVVPRALLNHHDDLDEFEDLEDEFMLEQAQKPAMKHRLDDGSPTKDNPRKKKAHQRGKDSQNFLDI